MSSSGSFRRFQHLCVFFREFQKLSTSLCHLQGVSEAFDTFVLSSGSLKNFRHLCVIFREFQKLSTPLCHLQGVSKAFDTFVSSSGSFKSLYFIKLHKFLKLLIFQFHKIIIFVFIWSSLNDTIYSVQCNSVLWQQRFCKNLELLVMKYLYFVVSFIDIDIDISVNCNWVATR